MSSTSDGPQHRLDMFTKERAVTTKMEKQPRFCCLEFHQHKKHRLAEVRVCVPIFLQLCGHNTSRVCSHRGRNGFSPHKKVPVQSHNSFLDQRSRKVNVFFSQEPFLCGVRTLSSHPHTTGSAGATDTRTPTTQQMFALIGSVTASCPWLSDSFHASHAHVNRQLGPTLASLVWDVGVN